MPRPDTRRATVRPHCEKLEDRCMLSAGDFDTSFDDDGVAELTTGATSRYATEVIQQPDGKYLGLGSFQSNVSGGSGHNFALTRFLPDGTFDVTFDGDGVVSTDLGGGEYLNDGYLYPDGRILVAGSTLSSSRPGPLHT